MLGQLINIEFVHNLQSWGRAVPDSGKYEEGVINLQKQERAENIFTLSPAYKTEMILDPYWFNDLLAKRKIFPKVECLSGAELKPVSRLILQVHSIAKLANTHPPMATTAQ